MNAALKDWITRLVVCLKSEFGAKLLFVGLQGSQRRGEATAESDIDLVVALDQLGGEELKRYKAVISSMPFHEKACGFICGAEELRAWPRYDLIQLYCDTETIFGKWELLLPALTEKDACEAVCIGAANLYHAACHSLLYCKEPAKALPGLYKNALFILRMDYYRKSGIYIDLGQELLPLLEKDDLVLLKNCLACKKLSGVYAGELEREYMGIIDWSRKKLLLTSADGGDAGVPN